MNISGVVVRINPSYVESVRLQLIAIPGVEIHASTDDGRMVVTIENDDAGTMDTMNSFHNIKGIVSTSLIYHHFGEFEQQSELEQ